MLTRQSFSLGSPSFSFTFVISVPFVVTGMQRGVVNMPDKKKEPRKDSEGRTLEELERQFVSLRQKYDKLYKAHLKLHEQFIELRDKGSGNQDKKEALHLKGVELHEQAEQVLDNAKKILKEAEKRRTAKARESGGSV